MQPRKKPDGSPWKVLVAFLLAITLPGIIFGQEICNNGIDDDGNGLIDLNDPGCPCSTALILPGVQSYIRNPSFEQRTCCPLGFVGNFTPPWLDCATGWHQATPATTDYFNMCGYHPVGMPLPPPDGVAAVGFFTAQGYREFLGTCLTYPLPSNPLLAGTTYTLSLWIAGASTNNYHSQTAEQGQQFSTLFPDAMPLAIYGLANQCQSFPMQDVNCMEDMPGWGELGRVEVHPAWQWQRVSITFTPAQEIHSIVIGAACDISASFGNRLYVDSQGATVQLAPYCLVDDLTLTLASNQVLLPVAYTGNACANNIVATGQPPAGSTDLQWYLNGVALAGQHTSAINISAGGYGPGIYTLSCSVGGECLMGSTSVSSASAPIPAPLFGPASGCAPLTVVFADTTGAGTTTLQWSFGDGTTAPDSALAHTYTAPGTYDVGLTVQSGNGCTGTLTLPGAVVVYPGVQGQISAQPNPVHVENTAVQLDGSASGNIISWWWDLNAGSPSTATSQTVQAQFPAVPGEYPVLLVVVGTGGCVDTVRSIITVIDPGLIEMPNVFSPNGDGQNDRFIPRGYKGAPGQMEIFNRWGQVIFSTRNLVQGWSGIGAPDGTYFYIVTPDEPGAAKLTGHVTLVR